MDQRVTSEDLRTLAGLLGMPDEEGLSLLSDFALTRPWLQVAVDELKQRPLDQWQAEHCGLFINGFPTTSCPPFESHYRHQELHGPVVEEMVDFYQRVGLEATDGSSDYLGTMLECAAFLLDRNDSDDFALLEELWNEHLRVWVPRFAEDLKAHAKLSLYRELGERLAALVA